MRTIPDGRSAVAKLLVLMSTFLAMQNQSILFTGLDPRSSSKLSTERC